MTWDTRPPLSDIIAHSAAIKYNIRLATKFLNNKMPTQFYEGIKSLLPKPVPAKIISVLSIGCGNGATISLEYDALTKLLGEDNFTYTGIDINDYESEVPIPPNVRMIFGDASNVRGLLDAGLKPNTYDVIILRHPFFCEPTSEKAFKDITRYTIPYFLITGGALIVSLYHEIEARFFKAPSEKHTLDTFLVDKLYHFAGERHHNQEDKHSKILAGCASDKHMFCFINKINKTEVHLVEYELSDMQPSVRPEKFEQLIVGLGGQVTKFPSQFSCAREYDIVTDPVFSSYGTILEKPPAPRAPLLCLDSPLVSPLARVILYLEPFNNPNTSLFFNALRAKEYNRALRIACTSNSSVGLSIIRVLCEHKDLLRLNPNQAAGETQRNAFHYAATKGRKDIYDLLCSSFTDEGALDKEGNPPRHYLSMSPKKVL